MVLKEREVLLRQAMHSEEEKNGRNAGNYQGIYSSSNQNHKSIGQSHERCQTWQKAVPEGMQQEM